MTDAFTLMAQHADVLALFDDPDVEMTREEICQHVQVTSGELRSLVDAGLLYRVPAVSGAPLYTRLLQEKPVTTHERLLALLEQAGASGLTTVALSHQAELCRSATHNQLNRLQQAGKIFCTGAGTNVSPRVWRITGQSIPPRSASVLPELPAPPARQPLLRVPFFGGGPDWERLDLEWRMNLLLETIGQRDMWALSDLVASAGLAFGPATCRAAAMLAGRGYVRTWTGQRRRYGHRTIWLPVRQRQEGVA